MMLNPDSQEIICYISQSSQEDDDSFFGAGINAGEGLDDLGLAKIESNQA